MNRTARLRQALGDPTLGSITRIERALTYLSEEIRDPSPTVQGVAAPVDSSYVLLQMASALLADAKDRVEIARQLDLRCGSPEQPFLLAVVVAQSDGRRGLFELLDLWDRDFYDMSDGLRLVTLRGLRGVPSMLRLGVVRRGLLFRTELHSGGCVRDGKLRTVAWDEITNVIGLGKVSPIERPEERPAVEMAGGIAALGEFCRTSEHGSEERRRGVATLLDLVGIDEPSVRDALRGLALDVAAAAELEWRQHTSALLREAGDADVVSRTNALLEETRAASRAQLTWLFEEIARLERPCFASFLDARRDLVGMLASSAPGSAARNLRTSFELACIWSGLELEPDREEALVRAHLFWRADSPGADVTSPSPPRSARRCGTSSSSTGPGRD